MAAPLAKYLLNIAYAIDQLGNVLFWLGDPDETISSHLGRIKEKNGGKIPWTRPFSKIVDYGLDKIDKNHSVDAIEHDEGKKGLIDKP